MCDNLKFNGYNKLINNFYNKQIMFMGTGSNVGKTFIVSALCRLLVNKNINVAPFKPQNMSNNTAVVCSFDLEKKILTSSMGEISRAQWLQAKAAKIQPSTHMNPILLKPENQIGSQVIINGKKFKSLKAREYYKYKTKFLKIILQSYIILKNDYHTIIVEGAGSPAEINLRKNDIANMGFAEKVDLPVILIGDIDKGGVIAAIIGTYQIISILDRKRIKGFIINKFRGDISLLNNVVLQIEKITGWMCLGILPYFINAHLLPEEDSIFFDKKNTFISREKQNKINNQCNKSKKLLILVPKLPYISNFDDLDPLIQQSNIELKIIKKGLPLPINADLIILPGSKSTIADLKFLYSQGWDIDIKSHVRHGGKILGICGGFQMLGNKISDPYFIENNIKEILGLGLLDIETKILTNKSICLVDAKDLNGNIISAYEVHLGKTTGKDLERPLFKINKKNIGAISKNGQVMGSYLHGIFSNDNFRNDFLNKLGAEKYIQNYDNIIEKTLDESAKHIERYLDIKKLIKILTYK